jgi:uncharacterized protein
MIHAERRYFLPSLEIRAEGDQKSIFGHAAVFNTLSEDLGGFREKIDPTAFDKSLGADVRALWNHNPDLVMGRNKAKTLTLRVAPAGLESVIIPPNNAQGQYWVDAITRGDVTQMSFGFRTVADKWERTSDNKHIRTLLEVELFDVSPVTYPAYPQTDVAMRSLDGWREAEERAKGTPLLDAFRRQLAVLSIS